MSDHGEAADQTKTCVSGVYKAAEARLLLLMYQVNYVNQGSKLKDAAITPAKLVEDSWTMDGFVSVRSR